MNAGTQHFRITSIQTKTANGDDIILRYANWFCPRCNHLHLVPIDPNPGVKDSWRWNGSYTNPSLEPSVHVHLPEDKSCHVFLRKAAIEFCGDTTPSDLTGEVFANRTVPLGPLPAWYKPDYEDVNDAV